ncbi:cyclopropane-fatty-acyl-phospholipid synthase family protein [Methanobacterium sp. BAmetb5]|jgi:hypothetical protein|uniref:SAM-dependent methyltransferase n=1 Tax=Methanobacterium sp. BAmetb5 TaxID=2025351 RepID=UPI000E9F2133|nr:hypothetical protein [Methanobacterium sp. BAmetb5]AXV39029.1 MAG: hypothetical protein CIT02_01235 [Methanobacterium sp. BAmetb5]
MILKCFPKKIKQLMQHLLHDHYYILPYSYSKVLKLFRKFTFNGEKYEYFYHNYNEAWGNERTIEIPIIKKYVDDYDCDEILEVGNVLSHYFKICHDVVDKYEEAEGVINCDVVDYNPQKKYKLIVSISTLEHVGWDEEPKDPKKIFRAFDNLKNHLTEGGTLVVTVPIGGNPHLDNYLKNGQIKFTEKYYLKRISKYNKWVEFGSNFIPASYGSPYPLANALFIGIYKN